MKTNKLIVLLAYFFLYFNFNINAQQSVSVDNHSIRVDDELFFHSLTSIRKVSLYNPIVSLNGYDSWDSPGVNYYINGYKKELFPFNFRTISFLPANVITTKNIILINNDLSDPFGSINLVQKEIPEKMKLSIHLFLGGETGDPMHQVFTKNGTINRNKIQPSGEFQFSNKTQNLSYRIFGGFYGFFTQQDKNTIITKNINPIEFSEPNKNINGGAEFNYTFDSKDKVNILASANHYEGFDVSPSLPFMNYLTSNGFAIYSSYFNNSTGILFKVKAEKLEAGIEESGYYAEYEYDVSKVVASAEKTFSGKNIYFNIYANINSTSAENKTGKFLSEEINDLGYIFSGKLKYDLSENTALKIGSSVEKGFADKGINFESGISYKLNNKQKLLFNFYYNNKLPNFLELYSSFNFKVPDHDGLVPIFSGNEKLKNESINLFELKYIYLSEKFEMQFCPSYTIVDNKIKWISDGLENWKRGNGEEIDYISINGQIGYKLSANTKLNLGSNYNSNYEEIYQPEFKMNLNFTYNLPINANIIFEGYYQSEVNWSKYSNIVRNVPIKDLVSNYDEKTEEFFVMNITWKQRLPVIWGINDIEFAIRCENILNKRVKYLPMSCEFPRNFTINAFFGI